MKKLWVIGEINATNLQAFFSATSEDLLPREVASSGMVQVLNLS